MKTLPYRVLIVEDHPFQREYLLQLFRGQGVEHIETAEDGAEAILCLERQPFDLVVSDLLMPGMDGVQLIQRLGALAHRPQLALLSTASRRIMGGACQAAQALGLSVIGTIAKPAVPTAIAGLLETLGTRLSQNLPRPTQHARFSRGRLLLALARGEMQAWFQPKKSLHNGRIVAAEALVRWLHPQKGTLLPGRFIADLVEHGLEEALLWTVIQQTLQAQADWRRCGFRIPVSVNLPTRLLDNPSLPDQLADFVEHQGGNPSLLCFELTENSVTTLPGSYHAGACRLRMKGFGLAQDDFGQGYSSLYNLVSTPFTELKIDRALVHGSVDDEALAVALASTVALGRRLGLEVVAEGVERQEELNLLRRFQCDRVQGFLISEAVSPAAFEGLLRKDMPVLVH
ncbi:EAL domain-containing response regulator [Pseudomonas panipatensis]|uniref:EAL domain, c-di-GMP-specific phosphodiesterase class I (Or its enzymatically inactive variant) n=1 Tax=Pseudomonas panipatensis TaxID=428992 RepID=A0A1G8KM38_9PSED|nr:EAL domain-containing response regulator [Pseudomonas panipatensis]SDI44493.1 EAL domain, c-di-GMP-specific phosphodiesterase class I (or its enzymatically inactive variant) [Pseudomonas panipatensis]SMP70082.1 EAL domain, c-di-GMP-specific phosphodiesterase class I (or its enzymatically inactive variant) [Pseudomonas panipatensis]